MGHEHDKAVREIKQTLVMSEYWGEVHEEVDFCELDNEYPKSGDIDVLAVRKESDIIHIYALEYKSNWTDNFETGENDPVEKNMEFITHWLENNDNYKRAEISSLFIHDPSCTIYSEKEGLLDGRETIIENRYETSKIAAD